MVSHQTGPGHPERPERLTSIRERLAERFEDLDWRSPEPALREHLLAVHREEHVDEIETYRGRSAVIDADTVASPDSVEAAYLAAGASVEAVDAVLDEEARAAWGVVRPPGHHAEANRAMGFCFFNNIAIGAAHAVERGAKRVLIVDWDVHHGNGTQHSFEERRDVLVFNAHQFPFYPGTGALEEQGRGDGAGYTVNVPLPAGCGNGVYQPVFEEVLGPVADAYEPDLVMVSAGFDAHERDPLGGMAVTSGGFGRVCSFVRDLAEEHCAGKLILMLEGGYDLTGLSESVAECVSVLRGADPEAPAERSEDADEILAPILQRHSDYWPVDAR